MALNLKLTANVRRYVHVAAASRWRAFLQVCCVVGEWIYLLNYRVGKNHDTSSGGPDSGNRKSYTLMFIQLVGRQLHIPTC